MTAGKIQSPGIYRRSCTLSLNDRQQHYITFQESDSTFNQHSEEKERKGSVFGKDLPRVFERKSQSFETINLDFVKRLIDRTENSVNNVTERARWRVISRLKISKPPENILGGLIYAANLLRAAHDVTMVIVGEKYERQNPDHHSHVFPDVNPGDLP